MSDLSPSIPPESGKRYICRDGRVSGAMRPHHKYCHLMTDGVWAWDRYGQFDSGRIHESDLVSEYVIPNPEQITEFRVGDVCRTRDGKDVFTIVGIFPKAEVRPIVAYRQGDLDLSLFTARGCRNMGGMEGNGDLILPVRAKLPDLPEDREWHMPEAVTEEMIAEGWRPFVKGEERKEGDEFLNKYNQWMQTASAGSIISLNSEPFRTKRPLPSFTKRVPLGPADVPPGSEFKLPKWEDGVSVTRIGAFTQGVIFHDPAANFHSCWRDYSTLMKQDWEISRDSGKTWNPCSKEVPA